MTKYIIYYEEILFQTSLTNFSLVIKKKEFTREFP